MICKFHIDVIYWLNLILMNILNANQMRARKPMKARERAYHGV